MMKKRLKANKEPLILLFTIKSIKFEVVKILHLFNNLKRESYE